jgi:hypothetical protein
MSKALLARKKQFEYNLDQEFPRRGKCSAKDRVVEKLCVHLGDTKEKSTKTSKENPVETPFERKRHIPLILERIFASICPLGRKGINLPAKNASSLM